jgi:hypothetical protein
MMIEFFVRDEGNHRSGPYSSLAEAVRELSGPWSYVYATEDGHCREFTTEEQEELDELQQ